MPGLKILMMNLFAQQARHDSKLLDSFYLHRPVLVMPDQLEKIFECKAVDPASFKIM